METKGSYLATLEGEVVHGRGLGRTVGLPTANIGFSADSLGIEFGVYASIIEIDGIRYRSITNIGSKPTVESNGSAGIETNIFDFDADIYGKKIRLDVCKRLRGIRKFSSLEEVKAQTDIDKEEALSYFRSADGGEMQSC
ncbi:MAG TPA: FMN adenylyltransferase [Spirochaetaceae bacterium]|nr:FMN adenylyltransferase [Spirochaetaceae bacterium]